jgi:selenocysteine lyase/cysteine desulfurase
MTESYNKLDTTTDNNIFESYNEVDTTDLLYKQKKITCLGNKCPSSKNIIYADYIASGQPSPIIENYLINEIYPYYANTHSNAHNGIYMKNLINETKQYIKSTFNLSDDYYILFTGNGTTGAINHLVNLIEYSKYNKVVIYLSLYEHYSNHLPWIELTKTNKNITVEFIPMKDDLIDLDSLNVSLNNLYKNVNDEKAINKTLVICSVTACSNVTGLKIPIDKIKNILDKYENNQYFHKYYFSDYACSAPYVKIDGSLFDGFFFSPHKFIGGIETPGVLIAKKCLFTKSKPFCAGGGCVVRANSTNIEYEDDIEKRESAGSPNIIGIVKIKKILELKDKYQNVIDNNEKILTKLIKQKIKEFSKYPNFIPVLNIDNKELDYLPILSFHLKDIHYNFIVVLLNDLYGIQTRGGIACCGLLAEHIEKKYGYRGWCRVSFHWTMSKDTIKYIFDAIEYVIKNANKHINDYTYDKKQNLYFCK